MSGRNKHLLQLIKNARKGAQCFRWIQFLKVRVHRRNGVIPHISQTTAESHLTGRLALCIPKGFKVQKKASIEPFRNTSAVKNKMFVASGRQTKYKEEDAFKDVY